MPPRSHSRRAASSGSDATNDCTVFDMVVVDGSVVVDGCSVGAVAGSMSREPIKEASGSDTIYKYKDKKFFCDFFFLI